MSGGRVPTFDAAPVFVVIPVTDVVTCDYVIVSGSDYQAFLGAPNGGGGDVNVTPDLFFGCLIAVCFIGGWIAGAQR